MKRFIRRIGTLVLVLCILGLTFIAVTNVYVTHTTADRISELAHAQAPTPSDDAILILGCGVDDQGRPSPLLQSRLDTGIALYQAGWSRKIIMSGDHGRTTYDEVNTMKNYAIARGVPSEDIFMDHAGFSTYESLYRARDVFRAHSLVIVSQAYHLNRALYIADCLGLPATAVSAPTRSEGQRYRDVREWLARSKAVVHCTFQPAPTYLGPHIDLSGSGNVTNDGKTTVATA